MKQVKQQITRIDSSSPYFEKCANALARIHCPNIYPCADCGYPVVEGYCCDSCGSNNPYEEGYHNKDIEIVVKEQYEQL